jgi:hypothetical protein
MPAGELPELRDRLVESMQTLLGAYELSLARLGVPAERPGPALVSAATVSAGPFASTGALADFERALAEIPGVREVAIRGFEEGDRAIVDVQLADSRP